MNPFAASTEALAAQAIRAGLNDATSGGFDRDALLDFLFSHTVQARLGEGRVYVYDYPASQSALARVRVGEPPVAERFELIVNGVEIANVAVRWTLQREAVAAAIVGAFDAGHLDENLRTFDFELDGDGHWVVTASSPVPTITASVFSMTSPRSTPMRNRMPR